MMAVEVVLFLLMLKCTFASVIRQVSVLEHDDVTFTCAVEGFVWQGQTVNWYYNSIIHIYKWESEDIHNGYIPRNARLRARGPFVLLFQNVTVSDKGRYTCEMSDFAGSSITTDLDVAAPVKGLEISPRNETFVEGMAKQMVCYSLGGEPPPNVRWVNETDAINGKETAQLQLNLTAKDDKRQLICEAEQEHKLLKKQKVREEVSLNVLYKPRIGIHVKEGVNLTITVVAKSNPPPTLLTLSRNSTLDVRVKNKSVLQYSKINVKNSDAGTYVFTAVNAVNYTERTITLKFHCDDNGQCGVFREKRAWKQKEHEQTLTNVEKIVIVALLSFLILLCCVVLPAVICKVHTGEQEEIPPNVPPRLVFSSDDETCVLEPFD